MSILLLPLLLVAAQAQPAAHSPAVQEEIVVLGNSLARWTGNYQVRGSRAKCATKKSSGDSAVDAIGCTSFEACLPRLQDRIDVSDRKDLAKSVRADMKALIKHDLSTCVAQERDQALADLAERRFQTRQRTTNASN